MSVLVTGGAGFIGSHVCERLLEEGNEVVCVDDFNDFYSPKTKKNNLSLLECDNFTSIKADIRDNKSLGKTFDGVDSVIHLAARAGIRPSIENPLLYEDVNVKGTLNLLELCREKGVKHFVFGSSSSVYGLNKIPFKEGDLLSGPISPYAATKIAGEALCHAYHHLYGIKTSILRLFTVYGPRGRPDMAVYKFTKLIDEGKPIQVYGGGTSKRDYTYVSDIVEGVVAAWKKKFDYEILNLGDSNTVELNQLISLIENALEKTAKKRHLPEQPGDVPVTFADISKSRRKLGYKPKVLIEEGIPRFAEWYKSV